MLLFSLIGGFWINKNWGIWKKIRIICFRKSRMTRSFVFLILKINFFI